MASKQVAMGLTQDELDLAIKLKRQGKLKQQVKKKVVSLPSDETKGGGVKKLWCQVPATEEWRDTVKAMSKALGYPSLGHLAFELLEAKLKAYQSKKK